LFIKYLGASAEKLLTTCLSPNRAECHPILKHLRNLLSISLAAALVLPVESLEGQQLSGALPTALNIVVVEGEGVVNNISQHTGRDPVVRIEDESQRPIIGASVVFTLPTEGATGEFGNGARTVTTVTDKQGTAKAQGLKLYRLNGKVPIHVSASYRGLSARTIITQFVEGAPPGAKVRKGGSGKIIAILAVIGAGAAGGGYYAYSASKKTTAAAPPAIPSGPPAIGITPGSGTIAAPH
jgi:hypothetical protein